MFLTSGQHQPSPVTLSHCACWFCVQLLPLEEDLRQCHGERQEAQLRVRRLEQRVEELEERNAATVEDRERQVKLMEVNSATAFSLFLLKCGLLLQLTLVD